MRLALTSARKRAFNYMYKTIPFLRVPSNRAQTHPEANTNTVRKLRGPAKIGNTPNLRQLARKTREKGEILHSDWSTAPCTPPIHTKPPLFFHHTRHHYDHTNPVRRVAVTAKIGNMVNGGFCERGLFLAGFKWPAENGGVRKRRT